MPPEPGCYRSLLPEPYLVMTFEPAPHSLRVNTQWAPRKNVLQRKIIRGHNLLMNDSVKSTLLSKLFSVQIAIVEGGIGETNEEAWLRHLTTHPEDHYVKVRIFNRHLPGTESRGFEIRAPEKITNSY